MGHIVLGAPGIDRFHFHDRAIRALRQRGHRVSILCPTPLLQTFWSHQDEGVAALPAVGDDGLEFRELETTWRGLPVRRQRRLRQSGRCVIAWLERERPDLLWLHQDRGCGAALLQFLASRSGCRVFWSGDGLLPHTLQVDDRGIDGDASYSRRSAREFRVVRGDAELLSACLANTLARTTPVALPLRAAVRPPLRQRLRAAVATWQDDGLAAAWRGLRALRMPTIPAQDRMPGPWTPPATPFVAVLLQAPTDPRVALDGQPAPTMPQLVAAVRQAVLSIDPTWSVVAVAPEQRGAPLRFPGCTVVPATTGPDAAATALAVVTINHPLAGIGLLAGTPVVHLGHALWGVRGVASHATLPRLATTLRAALARDYPKLRQRFLSWVFAHGHVWCSATAPNHNGMLGLVQAIEARLADQPEWPPLLYRRGPAWPLAVERIRP